MARLDKIVAGQRIWTVRRGRMGNTTVNTVHVHTAVVIAVENDHALISWNGNPPRKVYSNGLTEYKISEPCTVQTWNGLGRRMATREERKTILAERKAREKGGE